MSTWQKEPRQCPCVGSTPTRVTRIDPKVSFGRERDQEGRAAAELFSGMTPLESVKALLSLFVSHSQEEAKGKRTLTMSDLSRAHCRGVLVRRVFVEIPGGEREART